MNFTTILIPWFFQLLCGTITLVASIIILTSTENCTSPSLLRISNSLPFVCALQVIIAIGAMIYFIWNKCRNERLKDTEMVNGAIQNPGQDVMQVNSTASEDDFQ